MIEAMSLPQANSPAIGAPFAVEHAAVGIGLQARRCCRACSDKPPSRSRAASRSGRGRDSGRAADRRCGGRIRWSLCRSPRRRRSRRSGCCRCTISRRPAASTPILPASASSEFALQPDSRSRSNRRQLSPAGRDAAQAVFVEERAVADEPRRDGRHASRASGACRARSRDTNRLVDEAPARRVDRDQSGLGAVEREMRDRRRGRP